MTNPFRFSQLNFDMSCGYLPNSFNLQANMYMEDSIARAGLYNVPVFNMGSYTPYGGVSCPGELIFNYTLNQAHYQSLQMGGAGIFNSDGTLNLAGNIFGGYGFGSQLGASYNPFGGIGITPWIPSTGSSSESGSDSGKTDAEGEAEDIKNKNTSLVALLKKYKELNTGNMDASVESKINDALKISNSKSKDKYKALTEACKLIGKDELRKLIPNLYDTRLAQAGYDFEADTSYEYDNSHITGMIEDARYEFDKVINDNKPIGSIAQLESIAGFVNYLSLKGEHSEIQPKDEVLNIISLWNETNPKLNIIDAIYKVTQLTETPTEKETTAELIKPFTDALLEKAKEVKNNLETKEEKDKISDLRKNLKDAQNALKNNLGNTIKWNDLKDAFNDLYKNVRIAEATKINKEIENKYGFLNEIVEDTITDDLIVTDTKSDLSSEDLDSNAGASNYVNNNAGNNANNGANTDANGDANVETSEIYNAGKTVAENLCGKRDKEKNKNINTTLVGDGKNTYGIAFAENNVVEFLDGMYSAKNHKKGYFEKMDKRSRKVEIDINKRKEIIGATLVAAKNNGLENDDSYEALNDLYVKLCQTENAAKFNERNKTEDNYWNIKDKAASFGIGIGGGVVAGATAGVATVATLGLTSATAGIVGFLASNPVGWGVAACLAVVAGATAISLAVGKRTNSEVVDDYMRDLYDKIKENQARTAQEKAEKDLGNA